MKFLILKLKEHCFLIIILIIASVLLSRGLDKPFIGHHDWNGAFWGSLTRSYLNYFGLIDKMSEDHISEVGLKELYFQNYTPLLPLILVPATSIVGISEFSLRFTPMFFSLVMVFFIFKVGELLFDQKTAILAVTFTIFTPMFLYFGKLPDHEPIVVSLIVITFYIFLKVIKGQKKLYPLFIFFLSLSLLESWPAFFIIPPLIIYSKIIAKIETKKILIIAAVALVVVISHLTLLFLLKGPNSLVNFLNQGLARTGTAENMAIAKFDLIEFLATEAHYSVIYFTRILLVLSLLWTSIFLFKIIRRKSHHLDWALSILLIYPLSFLLIFRQLAFIHDYKLYHFLPFIVLSSAYIFRKILQLLVPRYLILSYILLVITISSVFTERLDFLNSLLKSNASMDGYQLGVFLKNFSKIGQHILVISSQFGAHFGVFTNFYSNRNIGYQDFNFEDFVKSDLNQKYSYVVYVYNRDTPISVLKYLKNNYSSVSNEKMEIFKIN